MLDERQEKMFSTLLSKLVSDDRNNVTLSEFEKFVPLYKHSDETTDPDVINDLSVEFSQRFDLYENITITDDGGEVVLVLPRVLMPVKSISDKFDNVVAKFHTDGSGDIPKYATEATNNVLKALLASQSSDSKEYAKIVSEYRAEFRELSERFIDGEVPSESTTDDLDWS